MAFRARFRDFRETHIRPLCVENGKRETANVKNGGKLTTSWDFAVYIALNLCIVMYNFMENVHSYLHQEGVCLLRKSIKFPFCAD